MNTPNKLTVARIIMTPIFLFTLLADFLPYHLSISFVLFAVASLTDYMDGNMARSRKLVTDFGKFLDPLADKMLTTSAFIGMMVMGIGSNAIGWAVILFITLFREFMIASLRLVTVSSGGKVVAANWWGKMKTVTQMVAVLVGLAGAGLGEFVSLSSTFVTVIYVVTAVFLWLGAGLCVISGAIYFYQCKSFVDPRK